MGARGHGTASLENEAKSQPINNPVENLVPVSRLRYIKISTLRK
jgi:hypothetical protein